MGVTVIDRNSQIKKTTGFAWVTNASDGTMQDTSVTASRAVASDSSGLPVASSTTSTELAGLHALSVNSIVATNGSGILTTLTDPLPVAHGGTGNATLTAHAVLLGEGTSSVAFASPGTSGIALVSTGASSDPAFGAVSLTAGVTGTLPIANGGTNSNASLSNGFVMASSGGAIVTNPASNALSMNNGQLNFVADPTSAQDAATKNYVDMAINGLTWKSPVAAATTTVLPFSPTYSNGSSGVGATLTATSFGALVIDGYTVLLNDRVLVQNQASAFQNGIYVQTTVGTGSVDYVLTRATDSNTPTELEAGTATFATNGSTNADKGFVQTTTGTIVIGTSNLVYITFTSAVSSYVAGAGLDLTGNVFSISTDTSLTAESANSVPSLVVNFNATGGIYNNSGVSLKIDSTTDGYATLATGTNGTHVVSIKDANIASDAAISFSKLHSLNSAHILLGNGSNVATDTAVSGDVSITNAGVTSISSGLANHFVVRETPSGTIDGSNTTFTLANTPVAGTEEVFLNGLLQQSGAGNDYTISGGTITYLSAPQTGDRLLVSYRK